MQIGPAGWLVLSLVAGGVASIIVPWPVGGRTPGGVAGALLLGTIGARLGDFLVVAALGARPGSLAEALLVAVLGAALLLAGCSVVARVMLGQRGATPFRRGQRRR